MKKIIIVNNNMHIGGVQKSLYNLLCSIDTVNEYDVTLLLFSKNGVIFDGLPGTIKIKECKGFFRFLGKTRSECKTSLSDYLLRFIFAALSRVLGRALVLKLLLLFEPIEDDEFDCAISFMHNGPARAFYGGTQEYVLSRVKAEKKVAFIHGDYIKCGACYGANNRILEKFDLIAACSDGCRNVFVQALPALENKCITVRNFNRFDEIKELSDIDPVGYACDVLNVIMVARLSPTKGIDRAINALAFCVKKGIVLNLHIVGGGSEYEKLLELTKTLGMENNVVFYSEQSNPYRFMKNADLFLLTSYHEAAPMVIDEAVCLGLPVLTTQTTSSQEMVTNEGCGWVCENSQEALNDALFAVLSDKNELKAMKSRLLIRQSDNSKALAQFGALLKD